MNHVFQDLMYDNSFVRELPADPVEDNHRRQVHEACYSRLLPTQVSAPRLIAQSAEMVHALELRTDALQDEVAVAALSGNRVLDGMDPYAACYGGHQFGNWAGQLGDGRAISLGEVLTSAGARWELQLKGAGPTPYSRMGDGRAVMRSSVREFLCSEAMHHLGVPTTRALSLVGTGDAVIRDMFYDGHSKPEPGAIVCRMAPSFLRFGNFEIFAARREHAALERLVYYAIGTHFSHLGEPSPEVIAAWLREICERTAAMVVHWMRVGFVHGVMNTDNLSILGLTIDYGPYGWLEGYDPSWTPNTTDASGRRYCYGNQPQIAWWNLVRFANALAPLVPETKILETALGGYGETLVAEHRRTASDKLGLVERPDCTLFDDLLQVLQLMETDMTIFFRALSQVPTAEEASDEERLEPLHGAYYALDEMRVDTRVQTLDWLRRYTAQVRQDKLAPLERVARMNATNPKYVLRNYMAQLAIDEAEKGDGAMVDSLLEVLRRPYAEQPEHEQHAAKRPEWARHKPGCSMLSCSS